MRLPFIALLLVSVAACTPQVRTISPGGEVPQSIYRINPRDAGAIQFRMLDGVNSLRQAQGLQPLRLNAALNAAAATHSRDMSIQNRPWHFGSDGSSPIDRVKRVGYSGQLVGELISETFESELETLSGWMANPPTRTVLLDPSAQEMGLAWFQEENGKIWWTATIGRAF